MTRGWAVATTAVVMLVLGRGALLPAEVIKAADPGVRSAPSLTGGWIEGLTPQEQALFDAGKFLFQNFDTLATGLGPRFNLEGCVGCHRQPAVGGSSPVTNPQIAAATALGARNVIPSFLDLHGPVREVRVKFRPDGSRDGSVHPLFVISGRNDGTGDAGGCAIVQDDFEAEAIRGNLAFRIPTPVFGAGLIEQIPGATILASHAATAATRSSLGIGGRANRLPSGRANISESTVGRFGWKAQNPSLLFFSGEAYAVEMGISNELFQGESDETPECHFAATPNSVTSTDAPDLATGLSPMEKFAFFMRFLGPPEPSPDTPGGVESLARGRTLFSQVGCALCHTPTLQTGLSKVGALSQQPVHLFSDLLLHDMGPGLADDVVQGLAGPRDFRTAPLWGLGQRLFFLHDGRTADLLETIDAHRSGDRSGTPPSEANAVIKRFHGLSEPEKQDVLNFLRSL